MNVWLHGEKRHCCKLKCQCIVKNVGWVQEQTGISKLQHQKSE